jgi:NADPH-dependent 2,4-dienoyl-CoA reductase/sulfur reductase-like enzyme
MIASTSSPHAASTATRHPETTLVDVLVIGGGQAGLATAYHLRSTRFRFEVLAARPPETCRCHRDVPIRARGAEL